MRNISLLISTIAISLLFTARCLCQRSVPAAFSGTEPKNYVRTWEAVSPQTNATDITTKPVQDVRQSTVYFDGLGRPLQTVVRQGSLETSTGTNIDMVTSNIYDALGREAIKYNPFAANSTGGNTSLSDGALKLNPVQQQVAFYNSYLNGQSGETNIGSSSLNWAYSQTNFETSPLSRIQESFAPGVAWVGSSGSAYETNRHSTKTKYWTNTATDDVKLWNVVAGTTVIGGSTPSILTVSQYSIGPLKVTYTISAYPPNVGTVLFKYRSLPSGTWSSSADGPKSPYTMQIGNGNGNFTDYEYAIDLYFNDGSPSQTVYPSSNLTIPNGYTTSTSYTAGTLYKNVVVDEQGHQVIKFTDNSGRLILSKVQNTATADNGAGSSHTGWLCTYYVYDDAGNVCCIISPKAVGNLAANSWTIDATTLNELCYLYQYDDMNRMILKKSPGEAAMTSVYDVKDRLVMSQDGNLRSQNKWLVTIYDDLNRTVQTGLWYNTGTYASLSANAKGCGCNYPFTTPPSSGWETLTVNHYDDYASLPAGLSASYLTTWSSYFYTASNTAWPYPQSASQSRNLKGALTWSTRKVLNSSPEVFLSSVTMYDDQERVIQSQSQNISGGVDVTSNQYAWNGSLLETVQQEKKDATGSQIYTLTTKYQYDNLFRIASITKNITSNLVTSQPTVTIVSNQYDALGKLKNKGIGHNRSAGGTYVAYSSLSDAMEIQKYDYSIRGWLLGANRDYAKFGTTSAYFGFDLGYDQINVRRTNGSIIGSYGTIQYNGNINGTVWTSKGDGVMRKFNYDYDNANRLVNAEFTQFTNGSFNRLAGIDFSVSNLSYDANGNILTMKQNGLVGNSYTTIDNLTYTYQTSSNKLQNVIDGANNPNTTLGDFRTATTHPQYSSKQASGTNASTITDYTYDNNGNLITDNNKAISNIGYNYLNIPQSAAVTGKGTITYVYDAAGTKLQKISVDNTVSNKAITTTTTYIGDFVYESKKTVPANSPNDDYTDKVLFVGHEEGRIRPTYSSYYSTTITGLAYDYFLKDQVGNVRMVLTDEHPTIYYPAATLEGTYSASAPEANSMVNYEKKFYRIDYTNYVKDESAIMGWNPEASTTKDYKNANPGVPNPNYPSGCVPDQTVASSKVYQLNGATNRSGLEFMIKVMAGDVVDIQGKSWYQNTTPVSNSNSTTLDLMQVMGNMLLAPSSGAAVKGLTATQLNTMNSSLVPSTFFRGNNNETGTTVPKAYINYMFFDDQFHYVSGNFSRVGANDQVKDHWSSDVQLQGISAPKSGYLFVYVSNESNFNVYFDNLQVIHKPGAILEETHYYPFGLTMAGISSGSAVALTNKYKFNGRELQQKEFSDGSGLETYDFGSRMYDAQIGRWSVQDRDGEMLPQHSPYEYCINNPILFVDPSGRFPYPIYIRSFAPFKTFGGGFAGDHRGWSTSTDKNTTSRMQQTFTIDPSKRTAVDGGAWSNQSSNDYFPILGKKTAVDRYSLYAGFTSHGDDNVGVVQSWLRANLPLIPSPDIDVQSTIRLTENTNKGILNVQLLMEGDRFPAAEAFIVDTKGQKLFIGVSPYEGSPLTSLPGNNHRQMMYANFDIKINDKGEFMGVVSAGHTYTVDEWNKMISSTPLNYDDVKKKDDQDQTKGSGISWADVVSTLNSWLTQNPNIKVTQ